MDIQLTEYKYADGQWNVKDSQMMWIFQHMEFADRTFYNVDITKWNPLDYFKRCRVFLGLVDGELAGLFWVSSWNALNKSGFFNFSWIDTCTIDEFKRIHASMEGLRKLLDMPDFRVLYAETSVNRASVLAYADYMGFVKLGIVPGAHWHHDEQKFYDTVIMYITADTVRR